MDTKGSLSTSGQAQASVGSTPCDWLLGNVFASGLSEGSRAEETHHLSEQLKRLPTPNGAITGPPNPHCPAASCVDPGPEASPPGGNSHPLSNTISTVSPGRRAARAPPSPPGPGSFTQVLLSLVSQTRVQRCPLPCSPACASSSLCVLVSGGHTGQSRRGSNF